MPPKQIDYIALAQQIGILPQHIQSVDEYPATGDYVITYLDAQFSDNGWLVAIDAVGPSDFQFSPVYHSTFSSGIHFAYEADPYLSGGLPAGGIVIQPPTTYFGKLTVAKAFRLSSLPTEESAQILADPEVYFRELVEDELMSLAFDRDLNANGFSAVIDLQWQDADTLTVKVEFYSKSKIPVNKKGIILQSVPYKN